MVTDFGLQDQGKLMGLTLDSPDISHIRSLLHFHTNTVYKVGMFINIQ